MVNFINVESYEKLSQMAAEIIADVVKNNENPVLGLATGSLQKSAKAVSLIFQAVLL